MVAAGFTGVADALSGDNNFFTAFSNDPRPEELSKELGSRYEIRDATIKKWCVGSPIQGAIDAITLLMAEQGLTAETVEKLVIELPDDRCALVDDRSMPNINVQHLVALTLVDGGMNFRKLARSRAHGRRADPRASSEDRPHSQCRADDGAAAAAGHHSRHGQRWAANSFIAPTR